jgi:hypothetical protein
MYVLSTLNNKDVIHVCLNLMLYTFSPCRPTLARNGIVEGHRVSNGENHASPAPAPAAAATPNKCAPGSDEGVEDEQEDKEKAPLSLCRFFVRKPKLAFGKKCIANMYHVLY